MYRTLSPINEKRRWTSEYLEGGKGWEYTTHFPDHRGSIVGIDPGVNFAITFIANEDVVIRHGKFQTKADNNEYAFMSFNFTRLMVNTFNMKKATFVLEGAAFNKTFGQVMLAGVRTGFYLGLRQFGKVQVPAPMSVRKKVFGDGRTQPMDIWPDINHNAADSLSIALYGI